MIPTRLLRAIEDGNLSKLPEPVYVQGFIKLYADALGLEGNEFADAFPTERSMPVASSSWKDSPAAQLRPLHLYLAYVLLILASVGLLSRIVNRSATIASPAASPAINTQSFTVGQSSGQTTAQQSPFSPGSPVPANRSLVSRPNDPHRPVRVDVMLTAQSWMRIVIDGETEFEGVLPEGTERTWMAKTEIIVRAGNAGGVLLSHNSGQAAKMGAPGAVEEKTFTLSQDSAKLP
jgi:cytoskeletal protein RodZ